MLFLDDPPHLAIQRLEVVCPANRSGLMRAFPPLTVNAWELWLGPWLGKRNCPHAKDAAVFRMNHFRRKSRKKSRGGEGKLKKKRKINQLKKAQKTPALLAGKIKHLLS